MSLLPVRFSRKLMFVPFVTKSQLKPKGKADEKCFYKIVCFVAGENSLIWERCKEKNPYKVWSFTKLPSDLEIAIASPSFASSFIFVII